MPADTNERWSQGRTWQRANDNLMDNVGGTVWNSFWWTQPRTNRRAPPWRMAALMHTDDFKTL